VLAYSFRQRSTKEKAQYAHKCATAGNVSKSCKIVSQEQIPACNDDTIHKLRDLHPERSLGLNLDNLPSPEALDAFWDGEDGKVLWNKWFSVKKSSKIFSHAPSDWCSRYPWLARA
jgi:hypothetical protein